MEKILRLGVFGTWRGSAYIRCFNDLPDVIITAICDKNIKKLDESAKLCRPDTARFDNFDDFINSGLFDAVLLTNYFNEHAAYAIRAMKLGIHVLSETISAVSPGECVDLVRAVEETGCKYMLAENYPYMCGVQELKNIYDTGKLGPVMYADGEYVHPMSVGEADNYAPNKYHWRRWLPRTYYHTHALAPLMYISGATPKKVNARTAYFPQIAKEYKRNSADSAGIMMCEMDTGSVFRISGSCSFGPHGNWYRLGCKNGGAEIVRGTAHDIRLEYNAWQKPEDEPLSRIYTATWKQHGDLASKAGHGGGDFWVCYNFTRYILYDVKPYFDIYRSLTLTAVGIYSWCSVLNDGATYVIPDFTDKAALLEMENDYLTPFPDQNGNGITLPCSSKPFVLN